MRIAQRAARIGPRGRGRTGSLRVTGGSARGRRLKIPRAPWIRPTREAVREALFDTLGGDVRGRHVLDLYAGSGALGIEALSRGAKGAVFVESDPECVETIRENLERCGFSGQAVVIRGALPTALFRVPRVPGQAFGLVLMDPPYGSPSAVATLEGLDRFSLLAEDATIVWELGSKDRPRPLAGVFRPEKDRTYGNTTLLFLRYAPGEKRSDGER